MLIKTNEEQIKGGEFLSVGITWIDGRAIFKHNKIHSQCWYGICHLSKSVCIITPSDFDIPKMITTIKVYPEVKMCERAFICLNFKCPLNRFDKFAFKNEFKDVGFFSLALPSDIGTRPLWFSEEKYMTFWEKFILGIDGGRISYNENMKDKVGE